MLAKITPVRQNLDRSGFMRRIVLLTMFFGTLLAGYYNYLQKFQTLGMNQVESLRALYTSPPEELDQLEHSAHQLTRPDLDQ